MSMENKKLIKNEVMVNNSSETDDEMFQTESNRFLSPDQIQTTVKDRWNFVYVSFLFFGLCTVIPWNFFITAEEYWMYKLKNVNITDHDIITNKNYTYLQKAFGSYLSIASMIPGSLFLFINTLISDKISHQIRSNVSLAVMSVLFILTTVLTRVDTDRWQNEFFIITMVTAVLINSSSGLLQGAIMGVGNAFPSRYMQALMNGQSIGAIFANLMNIGSIALGSKPENVGFIYFLMGVFTVLTTLALSYSLKKLKFYRYHIRELEDAEYKAETMNLLYGHKKNALFLIFKETWIYGFSAFLVFAVTLAVFPAIIVLVESVNISNGSEITNEYFIPVVGFLLFNLGDLTGRVVSGVVQKPSVGNIYLPVISILRIAFILLFMLCNAQPRQHLPVVFNSDIDFLIIILAFGLSNGYLVNLSILYAQREVSVIFRQTAGAMMAFYLGAGLSVGALLSNLLVMRL